MSIVGIAAILYLVLTLGVMCFLLALVAGAPWGELTLGGKWRGTLPPKVRLIPLLSCGILGFFLVMVLARAGVAALDFAPFSATGIWIVVAYNVLGVIANLATPSPRERRLWVPIISCMLLLSLFIALSA